MILISKPWKYGTRPAYDQVEEALLEIQPGDRVLPARYYYEKKLYITLVRKYGVGEYKHLPNGGYHCRMDGASYWFEPDEIILHPYIIAQRRKRVRWEKKIEKIKKQNKTPLIKTDSGEFKKKRGRPPLPPEIKLQRDQQQKERKVLSGGKRGRPKGNTTKKYYTPKLNADGTAVKRGRKPLSDEIKALRTIANEERHKHSGGKRGRPSDPAKKAAREQYERERRLRNPERKRGRPKLK